MRGGNLSAHLSGAMGILHPVKSQQDSRRESRELPGGSAGPSGTSGFSPASPCAPLSPYSRNPSWISPGSHPRPPIPAAQRTSEPGRTSQRFSFTIPDKTSIPRNSRAPRYSGATPHRSKGIFPAQISLSPSPIPHFQLFPCFIPVGFLWRSARAVNELIH